MANPTSNESPQRVVLHAPDGTDATDFGALNPFPVTGITGSLVPFAYDFIDLGYDGSNRLTTVVYKTGGAGGTTVATLTIAYVGATTLIDTVTRT
jgi:hypothetical protein